MGNKESKSLDENPISPGENTPIIGVHDRLLRQQKNRDPLQFYDVVEVLGVGSMGSVSKVKKKESVLGGSARSSFVDSLHDSAPSVCFKPLAWCLGKNPSSPKKGALVTPDASSHSSTSNGKNPKKLFRKTSSLITYGHKDTYFALKSIHLDKAGSPELKEELRNEVAVLKTLDHPNIVTPIETFEYKRQLCIVLELCSGGDLYARDPYTEKDAARITTSILSAIGYMHSRHITHRDLKYENIMFVTKDPHADVKIIDFGLSTKYGDHENMHDAVGTVYSMSPEVLRSDYSYKSDVWSTGVLLFMLLSSSMPFYGRSRKHVMQKILRGTFAFRGRVWKYISDEAKDFVTELLTYDVDSRPTAEGALRNPWLQTQNDLLAPEIAKMDIVQAAIEMFASYPTLKRLALMVIAYQSSNDDIGYLRRIFKKYDKNKDGDLELEEFKAVLSEFDYDYNDLDVERMFRAMDIDRTGKIHYSEFLAATIEAHGSLDEERLAEAFDRMDSDDSGFITVQNLVDLLGKDVRKSYIQSIISEVDLSRDHQIDYDEFLALWSNEDEESQRKDTLERITKQRLARSSTLSPSSSFSEPDTKLYLEVEELTADMSDISNSEVDEPITGTFLFKQEKAKSVRNFADI